MAIASPINWYQQIRNRQPVLALRLRGDVPEDFASLGITPTEVGSVTSTDGPKWLSDTDQSAARFTNATGAASTNYFTLSTLINTFLLAAHNTAWCIRAAFRVPTSTTGQTIYTLGNVNFGFILGARADYTQDTQAVCFRMANNAGTFKRCVTATFPAFLSGEWFELAADYDPAGVNPYNGAVTGSVRLSINGVRATTTSYDAGTNASDNAGSASALTSTSLAIGAAFNGATPQTYTNNTVLDIAYVTITRGRGGIRERASDNRAMFALSQGHTGEPIENAGAFYPFAKAMSSDVVGFAGCGDSTFVGDIDTETISSTLYEAYKIGHYIGLTRALKDRFGIVGTGVMSPLHAGSLSAAYSGIACGGFGSGGAAWASIPAGVRALCYSGSRLDFTAASWDNTAKTLTLPSGVTVADGGEYQPRVGDWINCATGLSAINYALVTAIGGTNERTLTCTQTSGAAINIANTSVNGSAFLSSAIPPTPFFVADGSTQAQATVSNALFRPKNLYFDFAAACTFRAVALGSTAGSASGIIHLRLNDGSSTLVSGDITTKAAAPSGADVSGTGWAAAYEYDIAAAARLDSDHRVYVNGDTGGAVGPGGLAYWQIWKKNAYGAVVSPFYAGGGLSTRTCLGSLLNMPAAALTRWMIEATAACRTKRLVLWYTTGENDDQVAQSIQPSGYAGAATRSNYYEGEYQNTRTLVEWLETCWASVPGATPGNLLIVKCYHPSSQYYTRRGVKHAAWRRLMKERIGLTSTKAQVVIMHPDQMIGFGQLLDDGYIPTADTAHPFYDTYNETYPMMMDALVSAAQASAGGTSRMGGFVQRVGRR